jgi:protein TonB
VKFTAPVIKKDNEVKEEDEIKLDEVEKSNKAVGAFTVEGNDEVGGEVLKAKEEIAAPEPPKQQVEENKVFDVVEQMPSFPGGMGALMSWLSQNIKYPVIAAENGVQGRVIVQFVVEKDGSITDVKVAKSVDPSLDKEASRVVSAMPKWTPGKQNGSAVRVKYTVPVTFKLQ